MYRTLPTLWFEQLHCERQATAPRERPCRRPLCQQPAAPDGRGYCEPHSEQLDHPYPEGAEAWD